MSGIDKQIRILNWEICLNIICIILQLVLFVCFLLGNLHLVFIMLFVEEFIDTRLRNWIIKRLSK